MRAAYQDSRSPAPLIHKGNSKFEMLFVNIFNLKQKITQIFQLIQKKLNFVSSRKQPYVPADYNF